MTFNLFTEIDKATAEYFTVDKECWNCGEPATTFIACHDYCSGCASAMKQEARQLAAEERRIDRDSIRED